MVIYSRSSLKPKYLEICTHTHHIYDMCIYLIFLKAEAACVLSKTNKQKKIYLESSLFSAIQLSLSTCWVKKCIISPVYECDKERQTREGKKGRWKFGPTVKKCLVLGLGQEKQDEKLEGKWQIFLIKNSK